MVASKNTVVNVYKVLTKHLSDDAITELLTELTKVKGNASFVQTIELLATQHNNNKTTLDDDGCVGCGIKTLSHPRNSTCPLSVRGK